MYKDLFQFEPLYPAKTGELEDLAKELVSVSSSLDGKLPKIVLDDIKELLQVVNSYYSNLIEGNSTHPIDIERAMQKDYADNSRERDLQIESQIHIEVQQTLTGKLTQIKESENSLITSESFLLWLHKEFYTNIPESLRWAKGENNEKEWIEAGKLRTRQVIVGKHIPPIAKSLSKFLERFEEFYNPDKMRGLRPIIALSVAHHRLMWIHPFLDGNGRVARLFTDAYFEYIGMRGYGLWNVSRGLAKNRTEYQAHLARADFHREGDLDGRGNLSDRTLTEFCTFFLKICLDQAEYMNSLLQLDDLLSRIENYVSLRNHGLVVDQKGNKMSKLHPKAGKLMREMLVNGEIARGEVAGIVNKSERTGRTIIKSLLSERLIKTRSEKGAIRLNFPAHSATYFFPNLYSEF